MKEILLGVLASLIASLVWWITLELYSISTRKKVNYYLMMLRSDNFTFEKCLDYSDYDLALNQAQRMLDNIGKIYYSIKPLTYFPTKKKLINTIICNLYTIITRFQWYYKGYDLKNEKENCCSKIKDQIYSVGYNCFDKNNNPLETQSSITVSINVLIYLNYYHFKSLNKILTTSYCFNSSKNEIDEQKQLYKTLIDINSFKDSYYKEVGDVFQISRSTFKRDEYYKFIDKLK